MSVVANVAINIDAKNAASVLNEIKKKVEEMNGAFDKLPNAGEKTKGLASELVGLGAKFVSVAAAAEVLRKSISASFERSQAETRLKALTSAYGETAEATKMAAAASDKFGLTQTDATQAIADVYGRLRPLGFSLKEISGVYDGFNVLSKQAALSTAEASSVFTQLSQALGSGTLRGDEFNRMAESMPAILGIVAKELNVNQGALRGMAEKGQITGDVVVRALKKVASGAKDLDKFLDPSTKAMNQLAKNSEEAQVQLGNLLKPAAVAVLQSLAKGFEFAAKNMKQIVQTATFFGTFAAVLWGIQKATQAWALAQKAAGVASAFLQAVINPASIATTIAALGVAATASYALGKAMDGAAKDAGKIDPAAQKAAKATTAATEEAKKYKESLEKAKQKANELAIEVETKVVAAARAAGRAIEQQINTRQAVGNIIDAQIASELQLNSLYKTQLERQYGLAKTAKEREKIAIAIFNNEVRAAQLVYQQTLARLRIDNEVLKLQESAAVLKAKEIIAEGKLQVLKAKTPEEARLKQAQLKDALGAQNDVIAATRKQSAAQQIVNDFASKTAAYVYKNSVAAAAMSLNQKLVSDEIGYSASEADKLSQGFYASATSAETMDKQVLGVNSRIDDVTSALDSATASAYANLETYNSLATTGIESLEEWRQRVLDGGAAQQQVVTATQQATQQVVASNNIRAVSATQTNKAIETSSVSTASIISRAWTDMGTWFQGIGAQINNSLNNAFMVLGDWTAPLRNAWSQAFDFMGGIVNWFAKAWYAIIDTLFITPLKTAWSSTINYLSQKLNEATVSIQSAWQQLSSAFANNVTIPLRARWDEFTGFLSQKASAAIGLVQKAWQPIANWFLANVTGPISKAWNNLTQLLPNAIKSALSFVTNTWNGAINSIKQSVRNLLQYLANIINSVGDKVNVLIRAFNALPSEYDIPLVGRLNVPAFADGGIVTKPTLAMVGEGGEPEYIIPASKMAEASANYLSGARGNAVVPAQVSGNAQINVTTGPVLQQGGQQYVTMADLEKAMRKTADGVYASLRTPAGRYATGVR